MHAEVLLTHAVHLGVLLSHLILRNRHFSQAGSFRLFGFPDIDLGVHA